MYELTTCPVCSSINIQKISPYRGFKKMGSNIHLFHCDNCKLVFCNPMPTDLELNVYNSEYFLNAHGGFSENPLILGFQSAINKLRVNYVTEYINNNKIEINNVLEIGPGSGMFIRHFKSLFTNVNYSIYETDLTLREKLQDKVDNSYSNIELVPPGEFDLIVCSHVLEHTNKPNEFLLNLLSKLRPSGILFIEVPCLDYIFKKVDEPHLLFFNTNSLSTLLMQNSFQDIQISFCGPKVDESKFHLFIRDLVQRVLEIIYEIRFGFIFKYIFFTKGKHYTIEEIITILPYGFLKSKKSESWWMRSICRKSY